MSGPLMGKHCWSETRWVDEADAIKTHADSQGRPHLCSIADAANAHQLPPADGPDEPGRLLLEREKGVCDHGRGPHQGAVVPGVRANAAYQLWRREEGVYAQRAHVVVPDGGTAADWAIPGDGRVGLDDFTVGYGGLDLPEDDYEHGRASQKPQWVDSCCSGCIAGRLADQFSLAGFTFDGSYVVGGSDEGEGSSRCCDTPFLLTRRDRVGSRGVARGDGRACAHV